MDTLELAKRDGVAVVRLDHPPVNAVNRQMMQELRATFESLSQDREVASVVLSAEGARAFCAGIDLNEMQSEGTVNDADMIPPGSGAPLSDLSASAWSQ